MCVPFPQSSQVSPPTRHVPEFAWPPLEGKEKRVGVRPIHPGSDPVAVLVIESINAPTITGIGAATAFSHATAVSPNPCPLSLDSEAVLKAAPVIDEDLFCSRQILGLIFIKRHCAIEINEYRVEIEGSIMTQ